MRLLRNLSLAAFALGKRLFSSPAQEDMITVSGSHGSCRIPLSVATLIVENIEIAGIHRSDTMIRLDGGKLDDLATRFDMSNLTRKQRSDLARAGDVGLESAALSFCGDVTLRGVPSSLVQRAQERAEAGGFVEADLILSLAGHAAQVSGRRLSGALAST